MASSLRRSEQNALTSTGSVPAPVYILLDVDRTLLAGTAWPLYLSSPNVFLNETRCETFRGLNAREGGHADFNLSFREKTLRLLSEGMSAAGLFRRSNREISDIMYGEGKKAAEKLEAYSEPAQLLQFYHRLYGERLRIVFLTAGYEQFMRGVVASFCSRFEIENDYQVVGSTWEINFQDSELRHERSMDSQAKVAYAADLHSRGCHIAFVADDDPNEDLFQIVKNGGGEALHVIHEGNSPLSTSWLAYAQSHFEPAYVATRLREGSYVSAPASPVSGVPLATNKWVVDEGAGIQSISRQDFFLGMDQLSTHLKMSNQELRSTCGGLFAQNADRVLLRGMDYYLNLPPRIRRSSLAQSDRLTQVIHDLRRLFTRQRIRRIVRSWPHLPCQGRVLLVALCDSLQNAALQILETAYHAEISRAGTYGERLLSRIARMSEQATAIYWSLFLDEPDKMAIDWIDLDVSWIVLARSNGKIHSSMRELDDPAVIHETATRVAASYTDSVPSLLVDFMSGGTELGCAVQFEIWRLHRKWVNLAHVAYSSKQGARNRNVDSGDDVDILARMVPKDRLLFQSLEDTDMACLLDNNATTFRTLLETRSAFWAHRPRLEIQLVVSAIWYENLACYLVGMAAEEPHEDWRSSLAIPPVSGYLTAFATWGTSDKTILLDSVYRTSIPLAEVDEIRIFRGGVVPRFKVCRVHNSVDLDTVVAAGATAIGIHAVEKFTADGTYREFPFHAGELSHICSMARSAASLLDVYLVVEEPYHASVLLRIASAYDLRLKDTRLQIQSRVKRDEIVRLRPIVRGLVCAAGADQKDLREYVEFLETILDRENDCILVDFSSHQPDVMSGNFDLPPNSWFTRVQGVIDAFENIRMPIFLAGDDDCRDMVRAAELMQDAGIDVHGIDTQNSTESDRMLRSQILTEDGQIVRKSPELLAEWATALRERNAL